MGFFAGHRVAGTSVSSNHFLPLSRETSAQLVGACWLSGHLSTGVAEICCERFEVPLKRSIGWQVPKLPKIGSIDPLSGTRRAKLGDRAPRHRDRESLAGLCSTNALPKSLRSSSTEITATLRRSRSLARASSTLGEFSAKRVEVHRLVVTKLG